MCHNLAGERGITASGHGDLSICESRKGISVWREDADYEYQSTHSFLHRHWLGVKIRFLDHNLVMKETVTILNLLKAFSLGLYFFNMLREEMGNKYKPTFPKASVLQS